MLEGTCHCGNGRWTFDGMPESVTACNCTLCRRYGVLWIYGFEGEHIQTFGQLTVYTRADYASPDLEIHFCGTCGCVVCWRGIKVEADSRRRMAVNLRLADPDPVAHLPINHFDGFDTFRKLPRDGRCVSDMWF
ncbi:MAG: GFA family protein [Pseudomonadota bacterium]